MHHKRFSALAAMLALLIGTALVAAPFAPAAGSPGSLGANDQRAVYLRGGSVDPADLPRALGQAVDGRPVPLTSAPPEASLDAADVRGRRLWIVQLTGPVTQAARNRLANAGAEVGDYIPDDALLVSMTDAVATSVGRLPMVRAAARFSPSLKLAPSLSEDLRALSQNGGGRSRPAETRLAVRVSLFARDRTNALVRAMPKLRFTRLTDQLLETSGTRSEIEALSRRPEVIAVESVPSFRLFNEKAAQVIGVSALRPAGFDGTGEIIGIADTGLDQGKDDATLHPDFQGQIKAIYTLGRPGDASDPNGHGTHVAGSALGTGKASGGKNQGMASVAKLVMQSVLDARGGLGGIPSDLGQLFSQAYEAGARIHSNSWGSSGGGEYDATAASVDRYLWRNDRLTVLYAAGNDGMDSNTRQTRYQTIASPGTAKNVITVGASENDRPDRGQLADDATQIASFSSRGPTADGRRKPDVVAPGTWVLSVRSALGNSNNYWALENDQYGYMGGTSMSTPITAGSVAILRQFLRQEYNVDAPAQLVKAALINQARSLGRDPRDQGWGRLDLTRLGRGQRPFELREGKGLQRGGRDAWTVEIPAGASQPLRLTLVWTDYPGSPAASRALVNDLDLRVTGPDGTVYFGNDDRAPYNDQPDRVNNVEQVEIASPAAGRYTVEVIGQNIPNGPQPYAAVWSGAGLAGEAPGNPPENPPNPPENPPTDPGNPPAGKTVTMAFTGRVESDGQRLEFPFEASAGQVAVKALAAGVAGQVALVAPDGQVLATRGLDDSGGASLEARAAAVGVYRLRLSSERGTGSVSLEATYQVDEGRMKVVERTDSIWLPGLVRWYRLRVGSAGAAAVNITWNGSADLDLLIYDERYQLVTRTASDRQPEGVAFEAPAAGWYYVAVRARARASYTIRVVAPR